MSSIKKIGCVLNYVALSAATFAASDTGVGDPKGSGSSNNLPYIIGGVIVVAIIIFVATRKKKD